MKFDSLWAQHLHPFFELVHIPFLKLFGLTGLFFSFPLVLFPLAIIAVYGFVLQLTHDRRWATYSAIAYVSIPWVNEQPFSGYIDFAVVGAMAFFLFALLRSLREAKLSVRSCALLIVATFVFSMSRQHAFYVAPVVFACVIAWEMWPGRPRIAEMLPVKQVAFLAGMFALALVPAGYQHVSRFLQFGSPIYPYQFKFLGIATHAGVPFEEIFESAGLRSDSAGAFVASFVQGWLWSDTLPRGFFDSRMLGVGLLLWTALIGFPIARKRLKGNIAFVLVLLVGIALLLKDFWMPRYSTTLTLALAICVGGILTVLGTEGPGWRYAAVLAICGLHVLGRPVYVAAVDYSVMHSNLADSRWFVDRGTETQVYPDHLADLLVIYPVRFGFVLQFYGRHLTNRIVGKLDGSTLQDACTAVERFAVDRSRKLLIVDHSGTVAKQCTSLCEPWRHDGCMLRMTSPGK